MKLFVILQTSTGKVVAISESKKDTENYIKAKGFGDDYFFTKIKNNKHCNDLMIDFDDLYLEHDEFLDMVLTRVELQMIGDILQEEKYRITSAMKDLEHMITNYSFGKKQKSILKKAYAVLDSTKKKKKLLKVIDLDQFIGFISKSKNIADIFRDKLDEAKEKMYLFINMKD